MNNNLNKEGDILLIWIDPNVDNEENSFYQNELKKSYPELQLLCFKDVILALKSIIKYNFRKIIIMISGKLYPKFYRVFESNLTKFAIIPKIIIFTSNEMRLRNSYGDLLKFLPLNDPFYNSHGIETNFNHLKDELIPKIIYNIPSSCIRYNKNERSRENNEKFNFECVKEINQLILPLFFSDYLNIPTPKEIQSFNQFISVNSGINEDIYNLTSQIEGAKNIPIEILSKFWVRIYTIESDFYSLMNGKLLENKFQEYLTYIQVLYEGVNKKALKAKYNNNKLYRGGIISKKEYNKLDKFIKEEKNEYLPGVIVYGRSFFSFSDDLNIALEFKERKKNIISKDEMYGLFIIDNSIKENICTSCASIQEFSVYQNESETLFFPFSCFDIIKMEKISENEFLITLNYLGKYSKYANLFRGDDPMSLLERIPESSMLAKEILNARIIKPTLKTPKWFVNIQNEIKENQIEKVKNPFDFMHNKNNQAISNPYNNNVNVNSNPYKPNIQNPYEKNDSNPYSQKVYNPFENMNSNPYQQNNLNPYEKNNSNLNQQDNFNPYGNNSFSDKINDFNQNSNIINNNNFINNKYNSCNIETNNNYNKKFSTDKNNPKNYDLAKKLYLEKMKKMEQKKQIEKNILKQIYKQKLDNHEDDFDLDDPDSLNDDNENDNYISDDEYASGTIEDKANILLKNIIKGQTSKYEQEIPHDVINFSNFEDLDKKDKKNFC